MIPEEEQARLQQRADDAGLTLSEWARQVLLEAVRSSQETRLLLSELLALRTLRHRPDRLIIGEVRGGEAFDLLDALNTGHAGSISTLHANSASQALSRLASLTLRADVDMPYRAIQAEIGDLINLVVHIERREHHRFVSQVIRIEGFETEANSYGTTTVYQR